MGAVSPYHTSLYTDGLLAFTLGTRLGEATFEYDEQLAEFAALSASLPKEWIDEWKKMDVEPVVRGGKVRSVYKQTSKP